ncbi:MAG: urea ABC transporter permease subunit UrtB [Candidatus Thiodiazotropha sp.]
MLKHTCTTRTLSLLLMLWLLPVMVTAEPLNNLDQATEWLGSRSFNDKYKAVDLLAEQGDEQARAWLDALLNNRLFLLKKDGSVVLSATDGDDMSDGKTGESLGSLKKSALKKITLNNRMRVQIRAALAVLDIRNPDPAKRLTAVEQMLDRPEQAHAEMLKPLVDQEPDAGVREAMQIVIALAGLSSDDKAVRIDSVEVLDGNLHPAVRNGLQRLLQDTKDPEFAKTIEQTLKSIQAKRDFYSFIENLFFGLSLGSVLVLAAIGLAITFGVMGVINMAHGELIMIGAYTTYVIQQLMPNYIGASVLIAIPAAFVVSALVGIAIERGVIRFLYGRPLETLLATFGISLILQQAVRSIFSPLNRSVETPSWMSGVLEINSALSLTYNRLYIILFSLLVFAVLYLILKKTTLGLQVRAVSQNRQMARAMGVRSEWVDAMTFGLGSGIAGVAGVALSQLTNVGPNLGQAYIIDSFMVVVFGGVGNLWGTLVSGMSLGVVNKFLEPWAGAVLAKILVLIFIILFVQKWPRGLFPQKGRAAEG